MPRKARPVLDALAAGGAVLFVVSAGLAGLFWWGGLSSRQRADLGAILRGTHATVDSAAYESEKRELADLRKRQQSDVDLEKLREHRDQLHADRKQFDRYTFNERARLAELHGELRRQRERLDRDTRELAQKTRQFEARRKARREAQEAEVTQKIHKLYRNMDPEIVAADLLAQFREAAADRQGGQGDLGAQKFDWIATIVDRLPDRFAADVLTQIGDSAVRNEILDRIRERKAHGSTP